MLLWLSQRYRSLSKQASEALSSWTIAQPHSPPAPSPQPQHQSPKYTFAILGLGLRGFLAPEKPCGCA